MTRIRAQCPNCHLDVILEPHDIIVRVGPEKGSAGYRFICEGCLARNELPLNPRGVDLLTAAGASVLQVTDDDIFPAESYSGRLNYLEAMRFAHELAETDYPHLELLEPNE